jgi:hypothetical protein
MQPSLSVVVPYTKDSAPSALALARGKWTNTRIKAKDDGEIEETGEAFVEGWGTMSVRGYSPFKNVAGIASNYGVMVHASNVTQYGFKAPVAYTG